MTTSIYSGKAAVFAILSKKRIANLTLLRVGSNKEIIVFMNLSFLAIGHSKELPYP